MAGDDAQERFHREWLGLAQPIEGLVFSVPVLADAQIAPRSAVELAALFRALLDSDDSVGDTRALFADFLGYSDDGMLVRREALPAELGFYAQEGGQEIRPSFAIARDAGSGDASSEPSERWIALVWDVRDDAGDAGLGLDLDRPEDATGPWRYPPTAKLERMLRHTGVPLGLLGNGRALRLVYAPARESTSHLTFRFADMVEPTGRPLLAAFELLLGANRTYGAAAEFTVEGLLRASRARQADVTKDLAAQVFEAVELLLEGFERAGRRDDGEWLRAALEEDGDHFYQGILSVVLRLVFLLYAEDQGLLPAGDPFYARHLSVKGLYDDLVDDAGMHPESMHHRFGAYGRLLALFRAVFLGVRHGELELPPRHGRLFDPSTFPFLEGGLPGSTAAVVRPEARAAVRPPAVDDGVIYGVLERLLLFEGQRLSYRALDVEQIGSVYESLMGYHVVRVASPAVRIGKNRVWAETAELRQQSAVERNKFLKQHCGLAAAQLESAAALLKKHADDDDLAAALNALSPGRKTESERHRAAPGRLVLQPGEERRRSGSHYTPRFLTEKIVVRTLEPILACLGDKPTEAQILSLKICDPAMGSGAFLVAACRHLADQLVAIWTRDGRAAEMAERHGDPHLHARRLVAQRCLYGVDKNAAAVELAKLSLWLVTMSAELPFTFVDHALRHGDSLVGSDLEQVSSFHWQPTEQIPLFHAVMRDALEQALSYREELLALADREDAAAQEEKRRLLGYSTDAIEKIRLVADVCIGAFFAEQTNKARETERARRQGLVERWLQGDEIVAPELCGLAQQIRDQHAPFHWWLEFPEIFYQERPDPLAGGELHGPAYMETFIGNPPFAGKNSISDANGSEYLDWLKGLHEGSHGNADVIAHFFRRMAMLCGRHGTVGFIATNTIAQGDTRATGLQSLLLAGWTIYDATASTPWPGSAAVTISIVHLAKGAPQRHSTTSLEGHLVSTINSRLRPSPERDEPAPLEANGAAAFVGSYVLGMGFTLDPAERDALVAKDVRNTERIHPYLGGQEINDTPTQAFDRYVIHFGEMSLQDASCWPDLMAIIRDRVKPERDRLKDNPDGRRRKSFWWQFGRETPTLFTAIKSLRECLVAARVSKHLSLSFQPTDRIFSEQLCVFALDSFTAFAVLQSRVHEPWARLLSSSMKTDLRYAASDCFDTFPFPRADPRTVIPEVEAAGEALYEARARFMVETDQGLTKTYNALKDPKNRDAAVVELRRLHEAMDRAVLDAYGWSDVAVPPFCPRDDDERQALAAFEDEVIDRLYVLNAERAAEEKRLGLGAKKKAAGKRAAVKGKAASAAQGALFGEADG